MDVTPHSAPRAQASLNLAGVIVACVLAALLMPGMPAPRAARAPDPVRLADAPPQAAASATACADQVWPRIDARCLKRADAPVVISPAPNAPAAAPATDAALSPLTITPVRPGMAKDAPAQGPAPVAAPVAPQAAPPPAQTAQTQPAADFSRTYTAGAAVADVEVEEGAADVPVPPRPKKRHGHRPFNPFGFLGIRF